MPATIPSRSIPSPASEAHRPPIPSTGRAGTLIGRLRLARRRRRAVLLLEGWAWSLLVAAVLLCLLQLLHAIAGRSAPWTAFPGLLPPSWAEGMPLDPALWHHLVVSGGVLAAGLVVASIRALWATPGLPAMARDADRRFALDERLSTALEVATRAVGSALARLDPVREALLTDAERRAAEVDPRRLSPWRVRPAVWALPALLLTLLLQAVPFPLGGGVATGQEALGPAPMTDAERAETAANLRRIADLLEKDADERSDSYLRAVAREIDRLGTDLERGGVERAGVAGTLERLLGHTLAAYEQADGDTRPRSELPRLLEAALRGLDPVRQPPPAATAVAETETPLGNAGGTRDGGAESEPRPGAVGEGEPGLDQLLAELEQVGQEQQARQESRAAAAAGTPAYSDYETAPEDARVALERQLVERMREQMQQMAGGTPAGAAQNAGRGAGDQAGEGVQPLEGDEAGGGGDPIFDRAEQVALPVQEDGDGRRIRIDIPPDPELTEVASVTGTAGDWRRQREAVVARQTVAAGDRAVVRRYFQQPTDAAAQGP